MLSFLRYNGRYCLWFPRGYRDWWWPQINPMESCSHGKGGKRTFNLHEPLWLFRLRQRVFAFGGRQRCPDRGGLGDRTFPGRYPGDPEPDTWDIGQDRNRTCSYCGSIHPDDLMEICRKTLTDERYGVEGTTKSYKVYVRQPDVMNASQGAIKFYMCHAPQNPTVADQKLFVDALRVTRERFDAKYPTLRVAAGKP